MGGATAADQITAAGNIHLYLARAIEGISVVNYGNNVVIYRNTSCKMVTLQIRMAEIKAQKGIYTIQPLKISEK